MSYKASGDLWGGGGGGGGGMWQLNIITYSKNPFFMELVKERIF